MSLCFQNSTDQFYRFAGQFDELLFDLDEEDNSGTLQSSQLQPDVNDQLQKVHSHSIYTFGDCLKKAPCTDLHTRTSSLKP